MDYIYGTGNRYTKEEIDKAKQLPSFDIEYDINLPFSDFHSQLIYM
jgi:hypothetical protein